MKKILKRKTFSIENQWDGWDEETHVYVEETPLGKLGIMFGGEDSPNVFIETRAEEVRILVYRYGEVEPEVIILDAITGGW